MSRKLKYSFWIFCLHVYAVIFTGPAIWRAITAGAISVGVFTLFTITGFSAAWVVLALSLAILKLVTRS